MAGYTVFDAETGEVLRSGACPDADLHLQSQSPREIVFAGQVNDLTHHMVEGWPEEKPAPEPQDGNG